MPAIIEGIKIAGSYDDVAEKIALAVKTVKVLAAVVLFGNAGNESDFLRSVNEILDCPIVGGGAAINLCNNQAGLLSEAGSMVSVLLITDEQYSFEFSYKNIHQKVLSRHRLSFSDKRTLEKIGGVDASQWLITKKTELGVDPKDFERLTFTNDDGINVHLSLNGVVIKSGADLHEYMDLRLISEKDPTDTIREFYMDDNAIIFGCAGLKGLLNEPIITNAVGLFMFGEVYWADNQAIFGNLMLSKIKFKKRTA